MKKQNLLSLLLFVTALVVGGCSSDPAPKQQFKANGESFNLKNAKLYLVAQSNYSNDYGDFVFRNYFLTDGTFIAEHSGWDIDDYTDATYVIGVQTLIPADGDFIAGSYPSTYYFGDVESGNALYFYLETHDDATQYYESTYGGEPVNFTISGDMEDGDTMTVKFSGGLSDWNYVESNWVETTFTGSILVSAVVDDIRPL